MSGFLALFASCGGGGSSGGGGGANTPNGNNTNPQNNTDFQAPQTKQEAIQQFQAVTDPAERQRLLDEMWAVLARPDCWDAPGSNVIQYRFFGQYQFAYASSTHVGGDRTGTVGLIDVGHIGPYRVAWITTTYPDPELVAIVDDNTLQYVTFFDDGRPIPLQYRAVLPGGGSCL